MNVNTRKSKLKTGDIIGLIQLNASDIYANRNFEGREFVVVANYGLPVFRFAKPKTEEEEKFENFFLTGFLYVTPEDFA